MVDEERSIVFIIVILFVIGLLTFSFSKIYFIGVEEAKYLGRQEGWVSGYDNATAYQEEMRICLNSEYNFSKQNFVTVIDKDRPIHVICMFKLNINESGRT